MPTIRSRPALTSAAGLLFAATLIIVVDVRIAAFDVVADVIGGVMVLVATLRIHGALRGADTMRSSEPGLAATWNGRFQLIAIVGVVPFVVGTALGAFASGTTNVSIQSPLALVLVVLLFIPLIGLLRALWRTSRDPLQSPTPAT
jgi:hypothetical protein